MTAEFGFDHVHLYTADLPAAARFYEQVFGMRRLGAFELNGLPSVRLDAGGVRLTLTGRAPQHSGRGNAVEHMALYTSDFDAAVEQLRAAGVPFLTEPSTPGDHRIVFVEGPDQVAIEVMSPATG